MEFEEQSLDQFKGQSKLPNFALRKRYDVSLIPDLSACIFSGTVQIDLSNARFTSTYMDGGLKKNVAVTQFEAVDARPCFPCWDEPALKELSSVHVVLLVSTIKGSFALHVVVKAIDLYKKYFSMPYTLPKLDMVAIPDFSGGAVENYGLITYREADLLYDELHSAATNKQRLAIVVTHEAAHQWFGNLVTMEWWTDLWLKEGFATWWEIWNQFLEVTALRADALENPHPIERSLRSYMEKYACENTKTEDLWNILSEESGFQSQFLYSGLQMKGRWIVPLTLSLGSGMKRKNDLLSKLGKLDISSLYDSSDVNSSSSGKKNLEEFNEHFWVKLNVGQNEFYRVKYDEKLPAKLRKAIEENAFCHR